MNYKLSRRILNICCLSGLALYLFGLSLRQLWMTIAFIVLIVAGIIQYAIFCRCPHCGAHFNSRTRLPKYCPECGKELE